MARAMRHAVEAGRLAYRAGRIPAPRPRRAVEPAARTGRLVNAHPLAAAWWSPTGIKRGGRWRKIVAEVLSAGARWIWFRDRDLEICGTHGNWQCGLLTSCKSIGGCLSIGGDVELAAEAETNAVHVRDIAALAQARRLLGPTALVGLSAHSITDALGCSRRRRGLRHAQSDLSKLPANPVMARRWDWVRSNVPRRSASGLALGRHDRQQCHQGDECGRGGRCGHGPRDGDRPARGRCRRISAGYSPRSRFNRSI